MGTRCHGVGRRCVLCESCACVCVLIVVGCCLCHNVGEEGDGAEAEADTGECLYDSGCLPHGKAADEGEQDGCCVGECAKSMVCHACLSCVLLGDA